MRDNLWDQFDRARDDGLSVLGQSSFMMVMERMCSAMSDGDLGAARKWAGMAASILSEVES